MNSQTVMELGKLLGEVVEPRRSDVGWNYDWGVGWGSDVGGGGGWVLVGSWAGWLLGLQVQ